MRICLATAANPIYQQLAVLYLRATALKAGLPPDNVAVRQYAPSTTPADIAADVASSDPDVVGLSCYIWNSRLLLAAASEIKRLRPAATVVVGGPDVGPIPEEILAAHPAVDIVVKGEGEVPLSILIERWRSGGSIADVAGIVVRRDGAIVDQGPPAHIDLDEIASPHTPDVVANHHGRIVSFETQRGCVFHCSFCFEGADVLAGNRRFPLDRVTRELGLWLDAGVPMIMFVDSIFNLNKARAKEICRFIAANNPHGTEFYVEIWAEFMDDELAALMEAANVTYAEVGLQTSDSETLADIDRRLRLQPFLEGISHLRRHGICFELQLIYGLPTDTPERFWRSVDFAHSLEADYVAAFTLQVIPGTEVRRNAAALGLAYDPEPPYFARSAPAFPPDVMAAGSRIGPAIGLLSMSRTVRLLCREPGVRFSDVVKTWVGVPRSADQGAAARDVIDEFCRERGLPVEFYGRVAALEFQDEPPADVPVAG